MSAGQEACALPLCHRIPRRWRETSAAKVEAGTPEEVRKNKKSRPARFFVIAEFAAIRNHACMSSLEAVRPPRWYEKVWPGFVFTFLICIAHTAVPVFLQSSLLESFSDRIGHALVIGVVFSGMAFVFVIVPAYAALLLLLRWLKVAACWRVWTLPLILMALLLFSIRSTLNELTPEGERRRFLRSVGVPIPNDARLVLAQHTCAHADHRQLWLLEGSPQEFEQLVQSRGWVPADPNLLPIASLPIQRAQQYFSPKASWLADAMYWWSAEENSNAGPHREVCLLANPERTQWIVWVVD